MKKVDLISGLIILVLAVSYLTVGAKLAVWKGRTLGPGFFPLLLGIALLLLCVSLLIKTIISSKKNSSSHNERFFPSSRGGLKLLYVIGAMVFYIVAFQPLGFLLSTFLFLSVLFFVWDPNKPLSAITMAAITVLCAYVFFDLSLKVQLPKGFLG